MVVGGAIICVLCFGNSVWLMCGSRLVGLCECEVTVEVD